PAQPSFVWQIYHYDLEPNAALYAVKKAGEMVHVQLNEALRGIEIVNNRPTALKDVKVTIFVYGFNGKLSSHKTYSVAQVPPSSTIKGAQIEVNSRISPLYFV